jgi:hypothetical protein
MCLTLKLFRIFYDDYNLNVLNLELSNQASCLSVHFTSQNAFHFIIALNLSRMLP